LVGGCGFGDEVGDGERQRLDIGVVQLNAERLLRAGRGHERHKGERDEGEKLVDHSVSFHGFFGASVLVDGPADRDVMQ